MGETYTIYILLIDADRISDHIQVLVGGIKFYILRVAEPISRGDKNVEFRLTFLYQSHSRAHAHAHKYSRAHARTHKLTRTHTVFAHAHNTSFAYFLLISI